MKQKGTYGRLYGCLGLLAAALLGLNLAQLRWAGVFSGLVCAPYEQIGLGLRELSLRGGAWDAAAWCLYLGVGLLPLLPLAFRLKARRKPGNALLGLPVCGLTLLTLYYMVNPSLLPGWRRMLLAGTTDSLMVVWLTVWVMERLGQGSHQGRLQSLRWLLTALDLVLVTAAFGTVPAEYLANVQAVAAANTGAIPEELTLTNSFLLAKAVVEALPLLLDLALVHRVLALLDAAGEEPFGETAAESAKRLALAAKWVVFVQAAAQAAFQLAQLAAADRLRSTAVTVKLPLFSMIFGVGAMVLAQWMTRGQEMREENDSFI